MPIPELVRPGTSRSGALIRVVLAGAVSGVLEFLAHPGMGSSALAFLTFVPVLVIVETGNWKWAIVGGLTMGLVAWSLSLIWLPSALGRFSGLSFGASWGALVGVTFLQSLPYALACSSAAALTRRGIPSWIALASLVPVCEPFFWPVPYSHAVVLVDSGVGRAGLSTLGRTWCTLWILLVNGLVFVTLTRRYSGRILIGLSAALAAMVPVVWIVDRWTETGKAETLRVTFLQSDSAGELKRHHPNDLVAWHLRNSPLDGNSEPSHLLVWGETTFSFPSSVAQLRSGLSSRSLPPVLFGAVIEDASCPDCPPTNSVVLNRGCTGSCRYDKQRLVPLAESNAPWLLGGSARHGFRSADRTGPVNFGEFALATPICFDAMFADVISNNTDRGARLAVNVVSDESLQNPRARKAFETLSRLSPMEHGMPILRVVDGGPSVAWDGQGKELIRVAEGRAGPFSVTFSVPQELSFYSRYRSVISIAYVLSSAALFFMLLRLERRAAP